MKKSRADSRDFNANRRQGIALSKIGYRCGSSYKGCHNCGDWEMRWVGKRRRKWYTSGKDVWRSYSPASMPEDWRWTYWCYTCGARDEECWENASDIGEEYSRAEKRRARGSNSTPGRRRKTAVVLDEETKDKLRKELTKDLLS